MQHGNVVSITVRGLVGRTVIVSDSTMTPMTADVVTDGPLEVRRPNPYGLLICPEGYIEPTTPSSSSGLSVGGDLNVSADSGSIAAAVIHGPVTVGAGGPQVGAPAAPSAESVDIAEGSVTIRIAPDVDIRFRNCVGDVVDPKGKRHQMATASTITT